MAKARILLMDDQKAVRNATSAILSRIGYEVATASDGVEATRLYEVAKEAGCPYDVVMLDLTVPDGMGGEEAIQKLREIDPEVKAVVFTGHRSDPVIANFRKHGFKAVITRPYKMEELTAALHKVMTGSMEETAKLTTGESSELRQQVAGLVHDLNNQLTAILDNIILARMRLEEHHTSDKALEWLADAEEEFDKVRELLSRLLSL